MPDPHVAGVPWRSNVRGQSSKPRLSIRIGYTDTPIMEEMETNASEDA
jgi:hypothetical protein